MSAINSRLKYIKYCFRRATRDIPANTIRLIDVQMLDKWVKDQISSGLTSQLQVL